MSDFTPTTEEILDAVQKASSITTEEFYRWMDEATREKNAVAWEEGVGAGITFQAGGDMEGNHYRGTPTI